MFKNKVLLEHIRTHLHVVCGHFDVTIVGWRRGDGTCMIFKGKSIYHVVFCGKCLLTPYCQLAVYHPREI